jgi:DNA-binding transcriptional ArsR family regulator
MLASTHGLNTVEIERFQDLAEVFKALSDPTRLRLIKLVRDHRGELCVTALARRLGVTQSAVSQHLRVLRQAGLVRGVRHGYRVHYSLDPHRLQEYRDQVLEALGEGFVLVQ